MTAGQRPMVCEYHKDCAEPVVAKIGLPSPGAIWACLRGFNEWQRVLDHERYTVERER